MEYICLLASASLFSAQIVFIKLFENKVGKAFYATTCFTLVSSVLVLLTLLTINGFRVQFSPLSLILGASLATVAVAINLIGIKAMAVGSVSIYTLFLMLGGTVLPFFAGLVWWKETPSVYCWIATFILIVALVLPTLAPAEKNRKTARTLFFILCAVLFLLNGINSTICKLQEDFPVREIAATAVSATDFLIIDYFFEAGFSLILFLGCRPKEKYRCVVKPYTLIGAAGFGVTHIVATLLQLYCASRVDAALMFPFVTGGTILFTPLLTRVFFREKIGKYTAVCMALSIVAGILFLF